MVEVMANNIAATCAAIGLALYFFCTAIVFMSKPIKFGKQYSVLPVDAAGKTEIRVYYGGISAALGGFLLFLTFACRQPFYALCGGLFFANAVFFIRFIFTFIDKGWKCPYTKLALPVEFLFIVALWVCFAVAITVEGATL